MDPLYSRLIKNGSPIVVHKNEFVRTLLDKIDGKYDEYLGQTEEERMKYVSGLYLSEVMARIPAENRRE